MSEVLLETKIFPNTSIWEADFWEETKDSESS